MPQWNQGLGGIGGVGEPGGGLIGVVLCKVGKGGRGEGRPRNKCSLQASYVEVIYLVSL